MATQHCKCGAKYKFPDSAIGKKAKCKKCGQIFRLVADTDEGTIPIADEDPFFSEIATSADRGKTPTPAPIVAKPIGAPDPALPIERMGQPPAALVEGPKSSKGYWSSVGWTFLFPTNVGSLITFFILWGILCVSQILLPFAWCIGVIGTFIIAGWYAAFRFDTIAEAAAGKDELPSMLMTDGVMDDIIIPLFKWIGSWAVAVLPAIVVLAVLIFSGSLSPGDLRGQAGGGIMSLVQGVGVLSFTVLVLLGLFLWPMIVLCICLGGFQALYRVDLIVVTIVKTFPVYLFTAAMVYVSGTLAYLLAMVAGSSGVEAIALVGAGLYFELVSMRLIGLYYHHFKHRFAWSWG